MVMDPCFRELSEIFKPVRLRFDDYHENQSLPPCFKLSEPFVDPNKVDLHHIIPPPDSVPSFVLDPSSTAPTSNHGRGDSPDDNEAFSDITLNYITKILMEEDLDDQLCMYQESSALQAAEKSLYEAIDEKYPTAESSSEDFGISQLFSTYDSSSSCVYDNGNWICYGGNDQLSSDINGSSLEYSAFESSFISSSSFSTYNGLDDSPTTTLIDVPNFFTQDKQLWQINSRVEVGNGYYPNCVHNVNQVEKSRFLGEELLIKMDENGVQYLEKDLRGKKNMCREDLDLERRRGNKHSASYNQKDLGNEMFDKVLLSKKGNPNSSSALDEWSQVASVNGHVSNVSANVQGTKGVKSRGKRHGKNEVVDLRTLLITCAQAVGNDERRSANELLKKIRQHSTPSGDGNERLAQVFADALEARLAGTGSEIYRAIATKRTTAADILKAYHLYISACPFKKLAHFFSNQTILDVLGSKPRLHIVDIGIYYGFQWPCLLHRLSLRPGGPPKLKITGIDLPISGFRPSERVEESGRRLAEYAQRFNVPFEYFAIACKWETIRVEDINVEEDEVLVVNCLFRLKNLFDETVVVNSPRNIVLNTIRKLNPEVFIHGTVNGAYSAPYFLTRFKEALFHYTAFFDILEATVPREHPERKAVESIFGREAMNIISCEGTERVERPETYKQWQVRNSRAGFVQLPHNPYILERSRDKSRSYHKDFVIDEDSEWILQGWKGRIVYALSTWRPRQKF